MALKYGAVTFRSFTEKVQKLFTGNNLVSTSLYTGGPPDIDSNQYNSIFILIFMPPLNISLISLHNLSIVCIFQLSAKSVVNINLIQEFQNGNWTVIDF